MQKGFAQILIIILIIIAIGGGLWFYQNQNKIKSDSSNQTTQSSTSSNEIASWKTYTNQAYIDEAGWKIQYPPDMRINVNIGLSRLNAKDQVRWIELVRENQETIFGQSDITITVDPNKQGLSVESWLAPIRGTFYGKPEYLTIAGRKALLLYSAQVVPSVNIFLSLNKTMVLWASGWPAEPSDDQATRELLISILNTLSP